MRTQAEGLDTLRAENKRLRDALEDVSLSLRFRERSLIEQDIEEALKGTP